MAAAAFLVAYEDAARGSPVWVEDPATRRRLLAPSSPRQGLLRDQLRGRQPARMDRDSGAGRYLRCWNRRRRSDGTQAKIAAQRGCTVPRGPRREARSRRSCAPTTPIRSRCSGRMQTAAANGKSAPCCRRRPWSTVVDAATARRSLRPMAARHAAGFFVARVPGRAAPGYRLRVRRGSTATTTRTIPIAFGPILGDDDLSAREVGNDALPACSARTGAKPEGVAGFRFAVWAPNARRVSVVGDFNDWDGRAPSDAAAPRHGVWELFVPGIAGRRSATSSRSRAPTARCCRSRPIRSPSRPSSRPRPHPSLHGCQSLPLDATTTG